MLDVCERCGARLGAPAGDGDAVVCRGCGHRRPFRRPPLLQVTGASGAGTSAAAPALAEGLPGWVALDHDVLWHGPLDADGLHAWRRRLLRLAANVGQNGRPVRLVGTALPEHDEPLPDRALFTGVRYLARVPPRDEVRRRLEARPAWRRCDEARATEMLAFDDWLVENAGRTTPPLELLDTGGPTVAETTAAVARRAGPPP